MDLQQFIEFCRNCNDADEIYDVYYDDRELCDAIYKRATELGVNLADTPEPMRASLEAIGQHEHVQILANW